MVASVHRLQFVHSATSMIMFHFFMTLNSDWRVEGSTPFVPVKAGTQSFREEDWVPAFAGMIVLRLLRRHQNRCLLSALRRLRELLSRECRRDVLGAAVPRHDLDQRIGAGERMRGL